MCIRDSPNPNDGIISGFSTSNSGVQSYSRDNKDGEWLEIARYKFNQIIQDDIQVTTDVKVADFFLSDGTNINIPSDTKNISVINSYVNDGVATFSIKGTAAVGNTLSISEDAADPDGSGELTYSWQISVDYFNWTEVSRESTYQIASTEEGKAIRAIVSYVDGEGFEETVITEPRTIPIPVTLVPEEEAGSIALAKDSDGYGYALIKGTEEFVAITDEVGNPIGDDTYQDWSLIAADRADDVNTTVWQHNDGGYWIHKHDSNWEVTTGGYRGEKDSANFYALETAFDQDLNDDGIKGAPPVNSGQGTFSIKGTAAVGNTLSISEDAADPDGSGELTYSWQTSDDGNNWNEVSTAADYLVESTEEGKAIRAIISYVDGEGFDEVVTTSSAGIPFIDDDDEVIDDGVAQFEITYEFTNNEENDSLSVFIKGNSSFALGGFTLRPSFVDPKSDNQNIEIDSNEEKKR